MTEQNRRGGVRRGLRSLVNFPAWMGWKDLSRNASFIKSMVVSLLTVSKAEHQETYEEAVERLNLSSKELQQRQQGFLQMAILYFILMLLLMAYAVYLVFVGTLTAVLMSSVLVLVTASLAFREHFWYFQMKQKRLGCSLKSWFLFLLFGGGKA